MKQRSRIYYTDSQKALMWDRWRKGESLQQIAQLFDRNHSSIQHILAETGGIRPAPRYRSSPLGCLGYSTRNILWISRESEANVDSDGAWFMLVLCA